MTVSIARIRGVATVTEIVRASRRLAQAERRVDELRARRDALIVEAHQQGESPKLLASVAGVSENQIFKILRAAKGREL